MTRDELNALIIAAFGERGFVIIADQIVHITDDPELGDEIHVIVFGSLWVATIYSDDDGELTFIESIGIDDLDDNADNAIVVQY